MLKSDSIAKIMPALVKAQSEMSQPKKDSDNPFYKSKYADLSSILEACQPALNANDICIIQPITRENDKSMVETLLFHSSGEFIGCLTEIKNTKPNDPQAEGSGITYARRYGLQSLLGLSAVDDDGNKASNLTPENKPSYKQTKEQPKLEVKNDKVTNITKQPIKQFNLEKANEQLLTYKYIDQVKKLKTYVKDTYGQDVLNNSEVQAMFKTYENLPEMPIDEVVGG